MVGRLISLFLALANKMTIKQLIGAGVLPEGATKWEVDTPVEALALLEKIFSSSHRINKGTIAAIVKRGVACQWRVDSQVARYDKWQDSEQTHSVLHDIANELCKTLRATHVK